MSLEHDSRKHKILLLETKLEILQKLSKGESGTSLAKEYGVSKSTVSEIKRKRGILLQYASQLKAEDVLKKRKTLRMASNTALEEAVYTWFTDRRNSGELMSGPLICEKALEINKSLGGSADFKASSGWLKNFKARHGIKMQDLILADYMARAGKNMSNVIDEEDKLEKRILPNVQTSRCATPTDSTNGCSTDIKTERTSESDIEVDDPVINSPPLQRYQCNEVDPPRFKDIIEGYTVSFPTVTTILQHPDCKNSEDTDEGSRDWVDNYDRPLNLKEEKPSITENHLDTPEDEFSGPTDADALNALSTAITWLEKQPDRLVFHLATLRKIRNFALYKERLRTSSHVDNKNS